MGHELSAEEINRVYDEFVRLADSKKQIYDQDLLSVLLAMRDQGPASMKLSDVRST
jgi:isopropylmalate/homocitrate/citramalate synthase